MSKLEKLLFVIVGLVLAFGICVALSLWLNQRIQATTHVITTTRLGDYLGDVVKDSSVYRFRDGSKICYVILTESSLHSGVASAISCMEDK